MISSQPQSSIRSAAQSLIPLILTGLLAAASGCSRPAGTSSASTSSSGGPPGVSVSVVNPERSTLHRSVRQPGSIQAFERTAIYSKLPGYVGKWHVDIGKHVVQGELLAELWVPDMEVEVKQKEALVQQADDEITQAREMAAVALAMVNNAEAKVEEAESSRLRATAEQKLRKSQFERLARVGSSGILDKEAVAEARYAAEAAEAGIAEVDARVKSARAAREESAARLKKAQADIAVAKAHLAVAKQNRDYAKAMLGYASLTAPYDGVITRRNVNTRSFFQPPSTDKAEPLYVVERRDKVRIFVEVPEVDADWVNKGAKALIRVQSLPGQDLTGTVARTSYAVDRTSRTLVAEIDLPNPKDQLRPNMYVSATITAEFPDVLSLPDSAVLTQGDVTQGYQSYCFLLQGGKVRRTPVELGKRGSDRVEVLRKQLPAAKSGEDGTWQEFTGEELVVQGNLSTLSDGQAVSVAPAAR